jgi:hypothetical protein
LIGCSHAAVDAIRKRMAAALGKLEKLTLAHVREELGRVAKDKKSQAKAAAVVDDLDMSVMVDLAGDIADELSTVTEDAGQAALALWRSKVSTGWTRRRLILCW